MAAAIQRRRGTTAQHATFAGLLGETTVDITKKTVVVHDGVTLGGVPLAKESDLDLLSNTLGEALTDHLTDASDAHDAGAISVVPTGGIAATDVQAALVELQSDIDTRLDKSGGTVTGDLSVNGNVILGDAAGDSAIVNGASWSFAGAATRIKGDFSNATIANRTLFQTSTINSFTSIEVIPNGTSQQAQIQVANNSTDPANAGLAQMLVSEVEVRFSSIARGSGAYLPMTFYNNGLERLRIQTNGLILLSADAGGYTPLSFTGRFFRKNTGNNAFEMVNQANTAITHFFGDSGAMLSAGSGGVGYTTGAGGAVTQLTSKGTGVTLNKAAGKITMSNAALAANSIVQFQVTNNTVAGTDVPNVVLAGGDVNLGLNYQVWVGYVGEGNFVINVKNITAGSRSEALVLNFAIIKGATS